MLQQLKCALSFHNEELVRIDDQYYTSIEKRNGTIEKKYHLQRFYKCKHCNYRRHSTDAANTYANNHSGLAKAKTNWLGAGMVPKTAIDPRDTVANPLFVPVVPAIEPTDPIHEINQTLDNLCNMLNIIRRDFDLESKYPKLKEAANKYQHELGKYQTYETLKGNK